MSIMHYRDYFFLTEAAKLRGEKTMVNKTEEYDLWSPNNKLTNADIEILNEMYCSTRPQEKVIMSPKHPSN